LVASQRLDGVHPNCPSGCMALEFGFDLYFQMLDTTIDTDRICVYDDQYYWIESETEYTFTCVGYGLETDVCPSHKMVCVGFEENTGLPSYGWIGQQSKAVILATQQLSNVHPQCPN